MPVLDFDSPVQLSMDATPSRGMDRKVGMSSVEGSSEISPNFESKMKKIIVAIVCILSFRPFFAQEETRVFIYEFNTEIPIFLNPVTNEQAFTLFQDTVYALYNILNIIEESVLRFRVSINLVGMDFSPTDEGWIDKKYCNVFVRTSQFQPLKIYSEASEDSSFFELRFDESEGDTVATVIGICKENRNFIKVMFLYKEQYYDGWINKQYCNTIYNSC
jgi:hypothetical protein